MLIFVEISAIKVGRKNYRGKPDFLRIREKSNIVRIEEVSEVRLITLHFESYLRKSAKRRHPCH